MSATTRFDAQPLGLAAARAVGAALSRKTRVLLNRGDSPRSGEKVWRNSYTEGTIEDRVWRRIHDGTARGGKRWTGGLLKAARQFEFRTRLERRKAEPGARNGRLGEVGLEVLSFLYDTVDFATGRLEPAIATIAEAVGRSYSAVHDALCRLRTEGFLHWMRRSRPIENPDPNGPQVEQVPNAYALLVPEAMKDWMRAMFRKAAVPDCEQDRRKAEREAFDAMLAKLTTRERHDTTWNGDGLLGETLARLATALDRRDLKERESGTARETGGSF